MVGRRLLPLVREHWFLFALCAALLTGGSFARDLEPLAQVSWLRDLIVASVLFVTALPVRFEGIKEILRSPAAVLLACAVSWIVIPLITLPLVKLRGDALGIGLMVAAAAPGTLASAAVWTRKANGNELIPIAVTLITNPLSCFVIPFWLGFVTSATNVALDGGAMTRRLAILVVFPMVAAQLLRLLDPVARWAARHRSGLSAFALCGLLTIVLVGAIQCGLQIDAANMSLTEIVINFWPIIVAAVGVHLSGLVAAFLLGRALGFPPADRVGIAFAGSQKTLMVGLAVALMLGGGLIVIPMVVYHAMQLLIDAALASRWSRQTARADGVDSGKHRDASA